MFRHISFNTLATLHYSTSYEKKANSLKIDRVIAIYVLKNTGW